MNPPTPDLRNQAVAWVQVFEDEWERVRHDPELAPKSAWSLLAGWGALNRFYAPTQLPAEVAAIPALLQKDDLALLEALRQFSEASDWLERAKQINDAFDLTVDEEPSRELANVAIDLFDRLDHESLAVCIARRLAGEGSPHNRSLLERVGDIARAEDFLADHVEVFFPAAGLAGAVLAACRPDLDGADPELFQTILKHRILEEAWEEAEAGDLPIVLSERDRQALQVEVEKARSSIVVTMWKGHKVRSFSRIAPPVLAAAAPAESEFPAQAVRSFVSPESSFKARLQLPGSRRHPIRLSIYDVASGEPARSLAGRFVCLAGVELKLNEDARAELNWQELTDKGMDYFLLVADEVWLPEQDT